ncbi:DNA repair protein RAD52 homolog isoform X3 [Zerene cesonia]|uniref:DNA repair protein RAD52 homolog isoform X3 n=1 Tax=Zerene cesonia TaxID=33412 RepID=UPI0018E4E67C|nr:DNA repair protein RAD52 homolog isoform X3 [Zerene cesonia]
MQRKPGFPVANCNIKMPESVVPDIPGDDDWEPQQRRQQLINFGHSQWTFNNWSWSVTKQDLDFVELVNGKYTAGVAAFVNVSVKSFDIHRENVGYATSVGVTKGSAIHRARKCAVTNALRETLLSFGGSVASDLLELLEANKAETPVEPQQENNPNLLNKPTEPKNSQRKDPESASGMRVPPPAIKNAAVPPVALAHPMPANLPARPPANAPRAAAPRPNEASEEEARAERKRRQRQAQEQFRLKQLAKQKDMDNNEFDKNCTSFDNLLMAIPTQDIVIEETGNSTEENKRKSPAPDASVAKRRASVMNKLDVQTK